MRIFAGVDRLNVASRVVVNGVSSPSGDCTIYRVDAWRMVSCTEDDDENSGGAEYGYVKFNARDHGGDAPGVCGELIRTGDVGLLAILADAIDDSPTRVTADGLRAGVVDPGVTGIAVVDQGMFFDL